MCISQSPSPNLAVKTCLNLSLDLDLTLLYYFSLLDLDSSLTKLLYTRLSLDFSLIIFLFVFSVPSQDNEAA